MERWIAFLCALAMVDGWACSSTTASVPMDAGAIDAPMDAVAVAAQMVWCSVNCGSVDAGTDGAYPCRAGQICGETGGVAGFTCCVQGGGSCGPGNPGPSDCPPP